MAYAIQTRDGSYRAVKKPLTTKILEKHVKGKITAGAYVLRGYTCQTAIIDIDGINLKESYKYAKELSELFKKYKMPNNIEFSGRRGFHLWFFSNKPVPASIWREALRTVVREKLPPDGVTIEIFPKQNYVGFDSLGSMIKLPFGIHRKTGKRAKFLSFTIKFVDLDFLYSLGWKNNKRSIKKAEVDSDCKLNSMVDMRILLWDLFGIHAVERKAIMCPFHDDNVASSAVYYNDDSWVHYCFAEEKVRKPIDIVQEKFGYTREQAKKYLKAWLASRSDPIADN